MTDTESAKVLRRLDEARRECRAWIIGETAPVLLIIGLGWGW